MDKTLTAHGEQSDIGGLADSIAKNTTDALRLVLDQAPSGSVSVVVDPALADPLGANELILSALASGRIIRCNFGRIHDNIAAIASPYVLHFADQARLERLIQETIWTAAAESAGSFGVEYKARSVCAWVVGEADPAALAARLTTAALAVRPDGSPWYLRFWDPRVIWHLDRVLPKPVHQSLLTQLGRWHTLDPLGRLVGFAAAQPAGEAPFARMRFDAETWRSLSLIGMINIVLVLARDWDVWPNVANAVRIERLIRRCESLGYTTEQDVLAFCACALTTRDDFDSDPRVDQALRTSSGQQMSLMQRLAQFDDAFWLGLTRQTQVQESKT